MSSGAVALGRRAVGIGTDTAPGAIKLSHKQAASAVGQFHLFAAYYDAFRRHDLNAAQVLLTLAETEGRRAHLNARGALEVLLTRGIVPIINENDVVSTAEIRFGDNDRLAARVAQMVGADALILLSTVDGLYTADPVRDPAAQHILRVERLEAAHMAMAADAAPGLSTGGMRSKLEAARIATGAGIAMLIADGRADGALGALTAGTARATVVTARDNPRGARQKWIQAHMRPRGTLTVDAGAAAALARGGSLLPVGVRAVEGEFGRGDAVTIAGPDGARLGVGLAAYDAGEARAIAGRRSAEAPGILGYAGPDALVHRNDMALDVAPGG